MTHEGTSDEASRWRADAAAYDTWFDQPWGRYASSIEHDLLFDAIGPVAGLEVCDAGCGTGRFMTRLEAEGARVVGVDADPPSLAVARTRVTGELVEGDVHQLPFDDDHFDVTVAVTVCEFAADPAQVIAELVRVTRPGGRVVIGSLHRSSPWGWRNHRQFSKPPWNTARFLTRDDLEPIARDHGTTTWRHGLYAPTAFPGLATWGPLLERIGRRIAPRHAAFDVLTITLPEHPTAQPGVPPFVTATDHDEPSVFQVENLLREARRQRHLGSTPVPTVCLLDPDGDVVRHLAPWAERPATATGPATTPSSGPPTTTASRSESSRARSAPPTPCSSPKNSPPPAADSSYR
jgi:SAM-dependent methyltransferase